MEKSRQARKFESFITFTLIFILVLNFTLAAEEQELKTGLLELMSVKEEMLDAGIGVARVSDLISEGYIYLNKQDYNKTREIISTVYKTRDAAFSAKSQLGLVNSLYAELNKRNISLSETTPTIVEWNLNYSQREFDNENFEEALKTAEETEETLLKSISARYGYLNESVLSLEEKITLLGLNKFRITTLKSLLAEALETGKLEELDIIEKEVGSINISTSFYEKVKLSIQELESRNLSAQRISDGLAEAEAKISIADYNPAISQLESLDSMLGYALGLKNEETVFERMLGEEKANIQADWSATEKLLEKTKYELAIGNYEEAESQLTKARQSFESTKASYLVESAAKKTPLFSLKEFVAKNWLYIAAIIIIVLLVLKFTQTAWSLRLRKKSLEKLEKELRANEKIVRELQKNYFVHRKISRESYDEAYEALQDKIISLKEKISMISKNIKRQETNQNKSKKFRQT